MVQMVVHCHMVPLITQGAATKEVLAGMARRVLDKIGGISTEDMYLSAAIGDVAMISKFILQLVEPSQEQDLKVLDGIMNARSGCRQLVKQAVVQCGTYKQLELEARQRVQACMTLMPELRAAKEMLQKKPAFKDVEMLMVKIPVWENGLSEGATSCVTDTILSICLPAFLSCE